MPNTLGMAMKVGDLRTLPFLDMLGVKSRWRQDGHERVEAASAEFESLVVRYPLLKNGTDGVLPCLPGAPSPTMPSASDLLN